MTNCITTGGGKHGHEGWRSGRKHRQRGAQGRASTRNGIVGLCASTCSRPPSVLRTYGLTVCRGGRVAGPRGGAHLAFHRTGDLSVRGGELVVCLGVIPRCGSVGPDLSWPRGSWRGRSVVGPELAGGGRARLNTVGSAGVALGLITSVGASCLAWLSNCRPGGHHTGPRTAGLGGRGLEWAVLLGVGCWAGHAWGWPWGDGGPAWAAQSMRGHHGHARFDISMPGDRPWGPALGTRPGDPPTNSTPTTNHHTPRGELAGWRCTVWGHGTLGMGCAILAWRPRWPRSVGTSGGGVEGLHRECVSPAVALSGEVFLGSAVLVASWAISPRKQHTRKPTSRRPSADLP